MSDYLTAYSNRMKRNEKELIELANAVVAADPTIEIYTHRRDRRISYVYFFKGETYNKVSFHEVPYRWSGCGIKEHSGGEDVSMPFDVNDVLTTFRPITTILIRQPNEYCKSKEHLLKTYFFLTKYQNE